MDFLSHLEELRKRSLISLAVFLAAALGSYFFSTALLDFLTRPLDLFKEVQLIFLKPYEAFWVHLKVALLGGVILSSPVLFTQAWLFVAPGLYAEEKKIVLPLILISVALFLIGACFAYTVVVPWGLRFLLSFQTEKIQPMLGIGPYFSFLTGMILACGILFDFPVFVVGLVKLGVIKAAALAASRKIVIVFIFIAAAMLTPSPDPVSQLFLAAPLLVLFEISLAVARALESNNANRNTALPCWLAFLALTPLGIGCIVGLPQATLFALTSFLVRG